jgi:hypothetical protein
MGGWSRDGGVDDWGGIGEGRGQQGRHHLDGSIVHKRGSPGRGGLWDGKAGELPHLPTLVVAPPRWPMAR